MGRFLLQGRRQNPGLPRTLKVLPHQRDTDQISRPVPRRSPPPDRPSRHWATQIPVRRDNTRKLSRHNLSAISPRSSSRGSDDRWRLCILTAMEPRAHTRTLQRRSLFVASCTCYPSGPSYPGETWSTSHYSHWFPRHRARSPLDTFSTSLKTLLASAKSSSITQPQLLVLRMDGCCHCRA